jgi:hypothetical protein
MEQTPPAYSKHRPSYFTPKIKFTPEEDDTLRDLVQRFGPSDWRNISRHHGTRNARQCRERWQNYLDPRVSHPIDWSPEDDARLEVLYGEIGPRWGTLASYFPTRSTNNVKNRFVTLQRQKHRAKNGRDLPVEEFRMSQTELPDLELNFEPFPSIACLEGSVKSRLEHFPDDQDRFGWFFEKV